MVDVVNHPPHYKTDSGLEAIDVLEAFFPGNPHLWTATKYLLRCGKKDDPRQELGKAVWYINRYLDSFTDIPDESAGSTTNVSIGGVEAFQASLDREASMSSAPGI